MRISITASILVILICFTAASSRASESLNVAEFRNLYDSILSGKTLVVETEQDGVTVKKERKYGKALDLGDGDFEIPVEQVITSTKDGKTESVITLDIVDRVNDLGGRAIIEEEIRGMSVLEEGDEKPEGVRGSEFGGVYRVGKNDKGGFEVNSFALTPSLKVGDDSLTLAGSMTSYSCYSEEGKSKCRLTVRDFDLGEYEPYKGYTIGEPIGGDYVEVSEEVPESK